MMDALLSALLAFFKFLSSVVLAIFSLFPLPTDLVGYLMPSGGWVETTLDIFKALGVSDALNIIILAFIYRLSVRLVLFFVRL